MFRSFCQTFEGNIFIVAFILKLIVQLQHTTCRLIEDQSLLPYYPWQALCRLLITNCTNFSFTSTKLLFLKPKREWHASYQINLLHPIAYFINFKFSKLINITWNSKLYLCLVSFPYASSITNRFMTLIILACKRSSPCVRIDVGWICLFQSHRHNRFNIPNNRDSIFFYLENPIRLKPWGFLNSFNLYEKILG